MSRERVRGTDVTSESSDRGNSDGAVFLVNRTALRIRLLDSVRAAVIRQRFVRCCSVTRFQTILTFHGVARRTRSISPLSEAKENNYSDTDNAAPPLRRRKNVDLRLPDFAGLIVRTAHPIKSKSTVAASVSVLLRVNGNTY